MLIVLASDKALIRYAKAPIASAMHHCKEPLRFVILTRGCDESDIEALRETGADITAIPMEAAPIKAKLAPWVSASSMDRLLLPDLLPVEDKCLYLDIDLCVEDDLADLFAMDTGEAGIAARTSTRKRFLTTSQYALLTGVRIPADLGDHLNFNAGVLLLSLEALRRNSFTSKTLSIVERSGCNDQIAVALYAKSKHVPLPARYNHWPSHESMSDPAIVHFVGPQKPWAYRSPAGSRFTKWL